MKSTDDFDIKTEMATVEHRLYAFKEKLELMVRRQVELEKRLQDAEVYAGENVQLQRRNDQLLAENCELRSQLQQLSANADGVAETVSP
ncbi:unnamed protein product [Enterobius vermicularis]|uniref:Protein phosphatase 1 regulatory subunit 21 n=1 Tax=Enterobius vermicularis TaxID=51028 RepID=A0A0N4VP98_ENTVE|nr:unnamed protein product [Enterobius vermicularis]